VIPHPNAHVAPAKVEPPDEWQNTAPQLEKLTADLAFLRQAPGPDGEAHPQIAELEARVADLQARAGALAVWRELAPHAREARTLTAGTAGAFAMLCRAVVQERALSTSPRAAGRNHLGLIQRIATWLKDFGLAPRGKPMVSPAAALPVVSKWAGVLK
jgi:hypothetical protein